MPRDDWTPEEIQASVDAYLVMLEKEVLRVV
jgi:hypothetical protein